jgi:O-antigen/teichoic acid export membrane protein
VESGCAKANYRYLFAENVIAAQMKKRKLQLGYEALWVLWGQIGVATGGIIGIKILTHFLDPKEFGRLSIANTIIVLIGMFFFGPLGQGLMRFWSISEDRNEIGEFATISRRYVKRLVVSLIIITSFSGIIVFVSRWHDWVWVIVLAALTGTFTGWAGIHLSVLMAARRRKIVALINSSAAIGKPFFAAIFVLLAGLHADYAIMGYFVATSISLFFTEIFYNRIIYVKTNCPKNSQKPDSSKHLGNEIISFSYPFLIWGGFAWAHQSCDRWAILSFVGTNAVGAYSVISQLAFYPLVFGSNFLSMFFIPIVYERAGELQSKGAVQSGNRILIKMTCIYVAGAVVLIAVFLLYHRELVLLVSNEKYVEFSYLLPSLTGAWSLYYLGQILSGFGLMINKPRVYLLPIVFSGILATAATFILSSMFGICGVIWALGISGLIYALWCIIIAKSIVAPKNGFKEKSL